MDEPRAAISMKLRSVAVARTISYATIAVRAAPAGRAVHGARAARLKVRIFFQPNVVLVSRFKIVIAAAATLDSDFLRKIPHARARARNRARNPTHLTAAKRVGARRI